MKRLIFFIFTIICATVLYTCASPVAAELPSTAAGDYFSKSVIGDTVLGVNVSSSSITIGFTTQGAQLTGTIINSSGTNTISGEYPNINFQNDSISGAIKFASEDQLKITFQQRVYPYLKMWDVVCDKSANP